MNDGRFFWKSNRNASEVVRSCFLLVERKLRILQNILAPSIDRKHPDTFCWTLIMRKSFSAWLFEKGTMGSSTNRRTSSSSLCYRYRRLFDFDRATFPRFPVFSVAAGAGVSCFWHTHGQSLGLEQEWPKFCYILSGSFFFLIILKIMV